MVQKNSLKGDQVTTTLVTLYELCYTNSFEVDKCLQCILQCNNLLKRVIYTQIVNSLHGKFFLVRIIRGSCKQHSFRYVGLITCRFDPKPSRPLNISALSHLGPKPSQSQLEINSWTLRSLFRSALVISAPQPQ